MIYWARKTSGLKSYAERPLATKSASGLEMRSALESALCGLSGRLRPFSAGIYSGAIQALRITRIRFVAINGPLETAWLVFEFDLGCSPCACGKGG